MSISAYTSIVSLVWRLIDFFIARRKIKITHEFYDNLILPDGSISAAYEFTIVSISSKKLTIKGIAHRYDIARSTSYSPMKQFINPIRLEYGDFTSYQVDYNEFGGIIRRCKKIQLLVTDSTGKVYRSKWVTVRKDVTYPELAISLEEYRTSLKSLN